MKNSIFGGLVAVAIVPLLSGCGPSDSEQKRIAEAAIRRTLDVADQSSVCQKLHSHLEMFETVAGIAGDSAVRYELAADGIDTSGSMPFEVVGRGGLMGFASHMGNLAGAMRARQHESRYAERARKLRLAYEKARHYLAFKAMTVRERKYVRRHVPAFVKLATLKGKSARPVRG